METWKQIKMVQPDWIASKPSHSWEIVGIRHSHESRLEKALWDFTERQDKTSFVFHNVPFLWWFHILDNLINFLQQAQPLEPL